MKITGQIERITDWKPEYNSMGILIAKNWYNIYGTEEECRKLLNDVKEKDSAELEIKDGTKKILVVKKVAGATVPAKAKPSYDERLESFSELYKKCHDIAKNILKEFVTDGFIPPEVLSKEATTLFLTVTDQRREVE